MALSPRLRLRIRSITVEIDSFCGIIYLSKKGSTWTKWCAKDGDRVIFLPASILTIEDDDDRAFIAQLYVQHSKLMFGIALSYLHDYHDAQDAVNDAIISMRMIYPAQSLTNAF